MATWQKYRKSPRFPSFLISFFLLIALLFMVSTLLWYGTPYSLSASSEVYSIRDNRSLPVVSSPNVEKSENYLDERSLRFRNMVNTSFAKFVKGIPANNSNWCERMGNGKLDSEEHKKLEEWAFTNEDKILFAELAKSGETVSQRCTRLKEMFPFINEPLSEEEREFPLAYGILVYKSAFQVYMMMSAIYQPQNIYCISIDEKASKEFKDSILLLTDCFPNIFVMGSVGPVGWCQFGVARSLFNCLRYLTERKYDWKYFQYLSGFDLPLKTNLEMVRIFKQLHGSVNIEVSLYQPVRLGNEVKNIKPPLTLWKTSMSSLIPREAANVMVSSPKVHELMRFLQHTYCSDEAVWTTVAGNPQELKIPGGFNAAAFHFERTECLKHKKGNVTAIIEQEVKAMAERHPNEPFLPDTYYISRYQVWGSATFHKCYSHRYKSGSCIFGVKDIPYLLKRPELVQHKMYLSFQPAAYFCLWKTIHERALDWRNQKEFKATAYSELPTVKHVREGNEHFYDDKCLLSLW
uniref:Uncharacterized protein n=2 Tax=Meloidogyne TaxID=189290 RepID=A0A6V7V7I9_MELEN|nr:unnamed protein product [Meloidogyne enterolobii]